MKKLFMLTLITASYSMQSEEIDPGEYPVNHTQLLADQRDRITQKVMPFLENTAEETIESFIQKERRWDIAGRVCSCAGKLFQVITPVFAFVGSNYEKDTQSPPWALITGILGATGIAFDQFASYAKKTSKEYCERSNKLLESCTNIPAMPPFYAKKRIA